jgi:hypothetical protein
MPLSLYLQKSQMLLHLLGVCIGGAFYQFGSVLQESTRQICEDLLQTKCFASGTSSASY